MCREEFERNGLSGLVTVKRADAYAADFAESLSGAADAVFLDLPMPWEAMRSARRCLRAGGRLCSFSPCMEQVLKSIKLMRELGFEGARRVASRRGRCRWRASP